MKSITVRNIPDEVLEAARMLSIKERRSLNNELVVIIENGLKSLYSGESTVDTKTDPWKRLVGKWKDKRSSKEIIDDIYSSRTIGRDKSRSASKRTNASRRGYHRRRYLS